MGIRIGGVLVVGLGLLAWHGMTLQGPDTDEMTSASVVATDGREDFTISNMESGKVCLLAKGRQLTVRSSVLQPESDCETVWPGLASASNWTQNEDGTVDLTDRAGASILTLAIGDGVAFESLEPTNAVLALIAVN